MRWAKDFIKQRDFVVSLGFALTNVFAHLLWNPVTLYWQYAVSAVVLTGFLVVWLVREWRRLQWFVTRFYCIIAAFDLLAEGLLQPFHKCTSANILCTGRMYIVFLIGWLLLAGWNAVRTGLGAAPSK